MFKAGEIFKSFKKGFVFGLGALAALVTTSLLAAGAMHVFLSGETLDAAKMNENFAIAAPQGAVMAFYLTSCPAGWVAADGTSGTPDLRGRFVRGRDDAGTGAGGNDPDGVRGLGAVQTDAFQGHRHMHDLLDAFLYFTTDFGSGGFASGSWTVLSSSATGSVSTDVPFGPARTSVETRPKNVALIYCMRKDT